MSPIIQKSRHFVLVLVTTVLITCLFATGALAAGHETLYNADYCFSASDFSLVDSQLNGIFVTDVPSETVGTVRYGARVIRAGDALPTDALNNLTLTPTTEFDREAKICYIPITDAGLGAVQTLKIDIRSGKNEAPIAKDSTIETYKNIENTGTLAVTDEEGDALTFEVVAAPRRGEVVLHEDGTFTYTPSKNKVGKDRFSFTATDSAGNTSNLATVKIEILKPIDKLTYSDMVGDEAQFTALWLRNNEIFSGENIAGTLCFNPDKAVTRGEFLVMVSKMTGLSPDDAEMTSGFSDEGNTPQWMRPYIVSALRAGVISGISSEEGLVFRPSANLTSAEAAVMLQNVLKLPEAKETAAFLDDCSIPTWASVAVGALNDAGIPIDYVSSTEPITRRDVATMLYAVHQLQTSGDCNALF